MTGCTVRYRSRNTHTHTHTHTHVSTHTHTHTLISTHAPDVWPLRSLKHTYRTRTHQHTPAHAHDPSPTPPSPTPPTHTPPTHTPPSPTPPTPHPLQVDLTLQGHHHTYQRTCALYRGACQPPRPDGSQTAPVHLVTGHAGAGLSLNVANPLPPWLEVRGRVGAVG